MKKAYRINLIFAVLFMGVIVFAFSAFNVEENTTLTKPQTTPEKHKNSAAELISSRKTTGNFETAMLFTQSNKDNSAIINTAVSQASFFKLDRAALRQLNSIKSQNITLTIPGETGNIELELSQVNFMPDDFKIITSTGNTLNYNRGLYYQGIIKGDNSSMAAISIFENEIMGIVSTNVGNYNLGALENDKNEYIYYNDRKLMKEFEFNCGVEDGYGEHYRTNNNNVTPSPNSSSTINPVKMFYVCDYQMYLDKGNNSANVVNYVTAVFNQVSLLYNNETIPTVLASNMFVYTSPDPYRTFSTSQTAEILKEFGRATKDNFDGHLAQLLSTRTPVTGAIAWVNVLCQSYEPSSQSGRFAYSQIENTFNNVPIYSWTIEVITHETGHNFGSQHTHACVWPTISGQIDSCYQSEGTCVIGTNPTPNGTIMSYCHIPTGGGINFNLGFGPLPGDTIRLRYQQALCIDNPLNSSETPLAFSLLQNYPNPFNPSTNIKFALPQDGLVSLRVFDVAGREIATLISNHYYPIGIFSYTLDATDYNLASGVYFYKLDVTRDNNSVYSEIKKMVLVK